MQDVGSAIFQMRFPQKLWFLLNSGTDAILWSCTGRTILLNYRILHKYLQSDQSIFKTTNISSFVRQLNLYGFRKVTSHLQDPICNSSNPYMHEYVHDLFKFGRPELVKTITRKALTMKRCFKTKISCNTTDQSYTPLQKARRAFQLALKKAAHDMEFQNSDQSMNINAEYEDTNDEFCENDETGELDWFIKDSENQHTNSSITDATEKASREEAQNSDGINIGNIPQGNLMSFSDDSNQQTQENFHSQFLSMPDLDAVTSEDSGRELLAEFNISNEDRDKSVIPEGSKECISLNCVLPSVTNDHNIDDVAFVEKNIQDHYNGEWDQMFHEIIVNKGSNQEGVSNLKELYSQISTTIDLLNT